MQRLLNLVKAVLSDSATKSRAARPTVRLFWSVLTCLFVVGALLLSEAASAQEAPTPQLAMHLDSNQIFEGESTILIVSALNCEPTQEPSLDYLSQNFDVDYMGASTRSSISVTYAGGIPKRIENRSIDYRYRLTPKATGQLTIDAPQVQIDDKTLSCDPVVLTVKESTKTDLVVLETSVSPEDGVYPLVPFEISVDVLVKEAPTDHGSIDVLNLICSQLGAPQLTIPWLQSRAIAANTVANQEVEDWLNGLSGKYGFAINNYQLSASPFDFGFSFFDERRPALFLPSPEQVERTDAKGEKASYLKYSFKRKMRAQNPTPLEFGPCSLRGAFVDFSNPDSPQSTQVFLSTKTLVVNVKPIPEENAPADYIGVYGNIKQTVKVSSQDVAVGDGFTLSIELQGYGAFDGAKAPDLNASLGKNDAFKIYPASERSIENGVAYDYKLRPLKKGEQEIPAIQTSYFNVEQGQFVQNTSAPIKISVRESLLPASENEDDVSDADADLPQKDPLAQRLATQKAKLAIVVKIGVALGALLALVALFLGVRAFLRYNAERIALSNRKIVESAQRRFDAALIKTRESSTEGLQQLRLAFILLISKRFRQAPDALTDAELVEFFDRELAGTGPGRSFKLNQNDQAAYATSVKTLTQMKEFFQKAEELRFGGVASFDDNFERDARELFQAWISFLKTQTKKLTVFSETKSSN